MRDIARELGVSHESVRLWMRQHEFNAAECDWPDERGA